MTSNTGRTTRHIPHMETENEADAALPPADESAGPKCWGCCAPLAPGGFSGGRQKRFCGPTCRNLYRQQQAKARAVGAANGTATSTARARTGRRGVDPTTADRQYDDEEREWMQEVRRYIERTGDKFPTFATLLGIAKGMGYRKVEEPSPLPGAASEGSGGVSQTDSAGADRPAGAGAQTGS